MLKNLLTRAGFGLLFVVVMLVCIWKTNLYFGTLFMILTILGMNEFFQMANKREDLSVNKIMSIIGGALLFLVTYMVCFLQVDLMWYSIVFVYLAILMIVELFRCKTNPLLNIAIACMGILYVSLPFSLMCYVASIPSYGNYLLMSFFIIIWMSDTGAYLAGVTLGKHKMFERISPKKTWEGFAGGLIFAMLFGVVLSKITPVPLDCLTWVLFSAVIFVFGVLGDLVESMLKRNLSIKDSGKFLPGHGGLLDRFDSSLIAAPALFMMVLIFVKYIF